MPMSTESHNLMQKIGPQSTINPWYQDFYETRIAVVVRGFIEDDFGELEDIAKIGRLIHFIEKPNAPDFSDMLLKQYYGRFDEEIFQNLPGIATQLYDQFPSLRTQARSAFQSLLTLETIYNIERLAGAIVLTADNQKEMTSIHIWISQQKAKVTAESKSPSRLRNTLNGLFLSAVGDFPAKAYGWLTGTFHHYVRLYAAQMRDVALHFPNPRKTARQNVIGFLNGLLTVLGIPLIVMASLGYQVASMLIHLPSTLIAGPINKFVVKVFGDSLPVMVGLTALNLWGLVSFLQLFTFLPFVMPVLQAAAWGGAAYVTIALNIGPLVQLGRAVMTLFGYNRLDNQNDIGISIQEVKAIVGTSIFPHLTFAEAHTYFDATVNLYSRLKDINALRVTLEARNAQGAFVSTVAQ